MADPINHPAHYTQGSIECLDYIFSLGIGLEFCWGSIIKYVHRWRDKGGAEDLKKAQFYLAAMIKHIEQGGG